MKQLLLQYASYNIWANHLISESIEVMGAEKAEQYVESSFSSVRFTVAHVWKAEHVWLQRLQQVDSPEWIADDFAGQIERALANWKNSSENLKHWLEQQSEDFLQSGLCTYSDLKGNKHDTPVQEILLHVFNHATYHRGQLVTMLRQVGCATIPATDFIQYVRKHPLPRA